MIKEHLLAKKHFSLICISADMWLLLCFLIHKCFSKKKEIQLGIRTEKLDPQSDLIQQKDPTCLTLDAVVQE